ncbi:hypothetical protein [Treponema sp.]|uniref:hypothetical protein n=1 Tax=Treponema sp. TaxID=166 RepID=UPI00298E67CD|nr:hypothetical protein [Treponema sp.]MCR5613723.1 hypothetical protein [Treponema sp.]
MKNKKNLTFVFATIPFILYIILCYKPLPTELQLSPQWTVDISDPQETVSTHLNVLPFKLGQNAGYFTHEGKIALITNFDYKATISNEYYAPYSQNSTGFTIYDTKGTQIGQISGSGFPYISGENIFLLIPGGAGFEAKDIAGNTITRFQHTSPITALNSGKEMTIVGFADGTLCTFDEEMNLQYNLTPSGSDIGVILGAAASQNGTYFACISGQNKQRFVLYKNENNHAKVIHHEELKKSIKRQTFICFSKDETKVYYNDASGLEIMDCTTFKRRHINIPGTILDIQESPVADSFFVLSKKREFSKNIYTVTILEAKEHKTGEFSFEADSAFILTDENALFIGKNTKISKMTISKE